jgi:hypothetical protein
MTPFMNHAPNPPAVYAPTLHSSQSSSLLQGIEGQALQMQIEAVLEQWQKTINIQSTVDTDIEYSPILPKQTFSMKVQMHMIGRGTPLPYELDDD